MRLFSPRAVALIVRIYSCLTGALAITAAVATSRIGLNPTAHLSWMAAASIAVAGSLVAIAGVWTATGGYTAAFWCFHFGLIAVLGSGYLSPQDLTPWDESWMLGPFASEAAVLALAGILAYASGASFILAQRRRTRPGERSDNRENGTHSHGFAGAVLVFGALATWGGIVISTAGLLGFFIPYEDYLQATADFGTTLGVVWVVLGAGVVMTFTGQHAWYRTAALVAYGCFALIALPLGLRSEVMFPTVAALIAHARRGRTLTPAKAFAMVAALLVIIPIVREVRTAGVQALPAAALAVPGLDALVEMGGSLHPVEKVVRWHAEGDPYELGGTYWAPFERAALKLLPGVRASAAEDDDRIMNVLVLDRIGAIGFSPVAEAYRNFGPAGVVVVLAVLGMIMGTLDTVRDPRRAVLLMAAIYVPLLINVRNSFVSVPAQCAAGVLITIVFAVVRHVAGTLLNRPYAHPAYIRSEI
jgi:O-antigen polysaccharide polymerase Wzy-like protein